MGGAGLDSLTRHARGDFLGAYYRTAGPLYERLLRMGLRVNLVLAGHLARPEVSQTTQPWAWHLVVSYKEAKVLEASFSQAEHELASMMLPRGNVITDAGDDPDSVNLDLPDTINCEVLPPLKQAAGKSRGYKHIAAGLWRLAEWRFFLDVHSNSSPSEQTKMLTHSGHGSVSALKLDTNQAKAVSPQCARVVIRRITGSAALGKDQLDTSATCTQCDHPAGSPEALERHAIRCPNGSQRHYMHAGLVAVIMAILLLMAGIPKSSIVVWRRKGSDLIVPGLAMWWYWTSMAQADTWSLMQ